MSWQPLHFIEIETNANVYEINLISLLLSLVRDRLSTAFEYSNVFFSSSSCFRKQSFGSITKIMLGFFFVKPLHSVGV